MSNDGEITKTIIALESAALERWGNGDPSRVLAGSRDPRRSKNP
jgi:hypothetical protein